jgi:hypothetical protein
MLLPPTHAWTVGQRWLIIAGVATGLLSFGTLVYSYERYHRGPSEAALYGTWEMGYGYLVQFDPGGTFSELSLFAGEATPVMKGRWYAGGSNIYLRVTEDAENPPEARRPIILHIVDIEPNDLRVRMGTDDVQSYKRVNLPWPPASNRSPQPTVGGRDGQI